MAWRGWWLAHEAAKALAAAVTVSGSWMQKRGRPLEPLVGMSNRGRGELGPAMPSSNGGESFLRES